MTKSQIKYYHLLKEVVEIWESNKQILEDFGVENIDEYDRDLHSYDAMPIEDVRRVNEEIFEIERNPANALKLGERSANLKRLREIVIILRDEYEISNSHHIVFDLTRDKLPKHMILPDGNYLKIEYQGIVYENTPAQAVFIDNVYQLFLDGKKTFKSQQRVDEIGGYDNISALFKNNRIYGSLIKSERKGIHYLDIEI